MRIIDLEEGVAGTLYHVMDMNKADNVFDHDSLEARWEHEIDGRKIKGTSFTRNKRFWFAEQYVVKITVDVAKIREGTKIYPLDAERVFNKTVGNNDKRPDRNGHRKYHGGEFAEEFVAGDLSPLHTFLENIEIRWTGHGAGLYPVVRNIIDYANKFSIPLKIEKGVEEFCYEQELEGAQEDEPLDDPIFFKGFEDLDEGAKPASLRAAVRVNGKVYVDQNHLDALDKILDRDARKRAVFDGDNRGFVTEKGRFLDRTKAAQYARDHDLFDRTNSSWQSWMETTRDLISEIPLREGFRLPLSPNMSGIARGSYGAFIVTMHGEDFLRLTTLHDDHIDEIKSKSFPMSRDEYEEDGGTGFGRFWMPFLNVAFPSGKILGHEGRHRAAMVLAQGGDLIPVTIYPRSDDAWSSSVKYWDTEGAAHMLYGDTEMTKEEAETNLMSKIAALNIGEDDLGSIKTEFVGNSVLKGEPTRSEGWDKAAWRGDDFPAQLVGQFNPSVVVPKRNLKIGLVKGYRHFRR